MEYKAINSSPYLIHFNPNHDKKNGRFTFKKAWDKIDTAVSKGYDAVEKVAKGTYRGIRKEFKDPSSADFNGDKVRTASTPKNLSGENLDADKVNKDIAPGKKPPEAFKTSELDADYARVKSAKIPELQSKLPWLNDNDDANKIWGEQNVKAADIGLKALNKIGRQGYDEKTGITNGDRSWFIIEDQTIGMPSIAWLASKGKNEKEIASIIDSNYRCQQANYEYEGQYNWLKNREEYEKYANNVPYKNLVWELSEYAGYGYGGESDDFINACVEVANESKVKHSVMVNCGNYLVHYNKNHSKANGQFTSGDGDGDGVVNDRKYQKLDRMSNKQLHDTFKKEIHKQRKARLGWSNQWLSNEPIGKKTQQLVNSRNKMEKAYKNSPEYKKWDKKVKALDRKFEYGDIDGDEYDEKFEKLMTEMPKRNFNTLHYVRRGNEFLNDYINKGGKDMSIAYLQDLGYNEKKSNEYVNRLIKSGMTLGGI